MTLILCVAGLGLTRAVPRILNDLRAAAIYTRHGQFDIRSATPSFEAYYAMEITTHIILVGLCIWVASFRRPYPLGEYLGLNCFSWRGLAVGLAMLAGCLTLYVGTQHLLHDRINLHPYFIYGSSKLPVLYWGRTVLLGPLASELFLSGLIFDGLSRSCLGWKWAIVITGSTWMAFQFRFNPIAVFELLGAGLLLGWVRYKYKSTWTALALDMAHSALLSIRLVLYADHVINW
jgi:membrane protease YdiL (CAAX protease family)